MSYVIVYSNIMSTVQIFVLEYNLHSKLNDYLMVSSINNNCFFLSNANNFDTTYYAAVLREIKYEEFCFLKM